MTKNMIDADVLCKFIDDQHDKVPCGCARNFVNVLKEKISELSTFDKNGWCWDMFRAPEEFHVLIEGDYGYAVQYEVSWHNRDACPSTPEAFEHDFKCLGDGYHKNGKIVAWRDSPTVPEFNPKKQG
jgi:hypothetical protein